MSGITNSLKRLMSLSLMAGVGFVAFLSLAQTGAALAATAPPLGAADSFAVLGRMAVLRKLKTPKLEYYYTTRNLWQRRRFTRIAKAVLAGIENRVFIPTRSWLCTDCQFSNACAGWG